MKMKKIMAVALTVALGAASVLSTAACAKEENIVQDGKTVNVRLNKSGWSDEYFTAWVNAFESLYAEEGYKINVVEAKPTVQSVQVTNEMLQKEKNGIDLYLCGQVPISSIVQISEDEGFQLTEDLTDVMNSYAINADGTEESVKIIDKLRDGFEEYFVMDSDRAEYAKYNGKWLSMPVATTANSLVVNAKLLKEKFGLEVPLTTNELLNAITVINSKYAETGIKPFVWAGNNAYRYWDCTYMVWYAQYVGLDEFNDFIDLDIDSVEEMNEMYDNAGLYRSLELMETMLHLDNAADGTIDLTHDFSQHRLLTDKAIFQPNGGWLETEMGSGYADAMKNISMIRMPVISELGQKLKLDGADGADAAKCEAVLKAVIAGVDESKAAAEIIESVKTAQGVTLTEEQVEAVREARGIYYETGNKSQFLINPYSDVKDIAKLFLRFVASDSGIGYLAMIAHSTSAFKPIDESILESVEHTPFSQSVEWVTAADKAVGINFSAHPDSKRERLSLGFFNANEYGATEWVKSMANNSSITAAKLIQAEKTIIGAKLK